MSILANKRTPTKKIKEIANLGFIIGNKSIAVIDTGGTPEIGENF